MRDILRASLVLLLAPHFAGAQSMEDKARLLQRNLIDKHLVDGLYVSMVPVGPAVPHTVDDPGNVIHAGVWTGRYLAGVGYQYAVTKDPAVRKHGGELLMGLRRLQEVTGKPGLLARGFVKGHGPVEGFERAAAPIRNIGTRARAFTRPIVSTAMSAWTILNAVLYGYAIYLDLAADEEQKKMIAYDVDRLMTHLLDNHHYGIVDLDGQVTQYGHVGIDPDPSRDKYYQEGGNAEIARLVSKTDWHPPLRLSLMALPDLLIAYHITGKARYIDEYRKVTARFADGPEPQRDTRPYSPERIARVNHSSEGQAYEALFHAIQYERDPKLLAIYRRWLGELWDLNWMEGNSLYTFMTLALEPDRARLAHAEESLALSIDTLRRYPVDRTLWPVMNSIRPNLELSPFPDRSGAKQALQPVPIDQRPLDNEYAWKGNPYALDGWLKPDVTSIQFACDDPMVAWFSDSGGHAYLTRDGMKSWEEVDLGLAGAKVTRLSASRERTFVVWAETDRGVFLSQRWWRKAVARQHGESALCECGEGFAGALDGLADSARHLEDDHEPRGDCRRAGRRVPEHGRRALDGAPAVAGTGDGCGGLSARLLDGPLLQTGRALRQAGVAVCLRSNGPQRIGPLHIGL